MTCQKRFQERTKPGRFSCECYLFAKRFQDIDVSFQDIDVSFRIVEIVLVAAFWWWWLLEILWWVSLLWYFVAVLMIVVRAFVGVLGLWVVVAVVALRLGHWEVVSVLGSSCFGHYSTDFISTPQGGFSVLKLLSKLHKIAKNCKTYVGVL